MVGVVLLAAPLRAQVADRHHPRQRQGRAGGRRPGRDRHRHQPRHAVFPQHGHGRRGAVRPAAAAGRQLQGRGHARRLQELLADRHRRSRSAATRASTRRSSSAPSSEVVSVVADAPLVETDSASLSRTVGPERGAEPAAGQPRPLLAAEHHRRRHQQRQLELARRPRAADDDQRIAAARRWARVNFQLDGGNNTAGLRGTGNPAPNPEAVQEFRVLTNSYAAEYGRYSAGVVDVVTKSGTNQFHGAAFEFFRNEIAERAALGAARASTPTKDPLDRNQFGGGVRRPDPEGQDVLLRQLLGPAPGGDLLPEHRRRADGARARRRLLAVGASSRDDPADGPAVPRRHHSRRRASTPAARTIQEQIRPAVEPAQQLLRGAARPTRSTPTRRRSSSITTLSPTALARAELLLPEGHRHAAAVGSTGNIPWVDRDFKWKQHNLNVADTWTLSPTTINQLRVTYMRQFGGRVNNPTTSLGDLNSKFTIQGDPDAAAAHRHRLLHRPDVDRRPRRRQQLLSRQGQPDRWSRGQPLVQARRRGVVREDRPRHAARQLRRLHLQRQQDRQRLRRLPARPAGDDDAGRADPEDRQRLRTSACSRRTTSASIRA